MKRRFFTLLWTILLLSLMTVVALSCNAAVNNRQEDLAITRAPKELAASGNSYEDLGAKFYAHIYIEDPKKYFTMPTNEKDTTFLNPYVDNASQIWCFTRQSDGSYKVRSLSSNLYMELYNGLHPRENCELWHSFNNDLPDQRWKLKKVGDAYQFFCCSNMSYLLKAVNLYGSCSEILMTTDASKETTHFHIAKLPFTGDYLDTPTFKLSNVYGGVSITWNKVTYASSYRVYRYNTSTKSWVSLKKTSGTSYVDKSVVSGKTYQYTVKCATPLTSKFTSKSIKYIAAPALKVTNTVSGAAITWNKVAGAQAYKVLYKTTGSWKTLGTTTGTKWTHKKVAYNVNYTYTAECISADKKKVTSAYDPNGVKNMIVKTPKVSVSLTPTGYQLNWSVIPGAYRYMVMIKSKATGWSWSKHIQCIYNNYFYGSAKSNQAYYFSVRCMDKKNKYISGYISTSKYTYIAAPKVKVFKSSGKKVTLSWGKVAGASKYIIYSWNGKKWIKRNVTASTGVTMSFKGTAAQNKCFAVKCLNKKGKVIGSYFETVLDGGKIHSYYPGKYTSKHKF